MCTSEMWKCEISVYWLIQLTSTLTDFKGPVISICYRRIFVIANIENKENLVKELRMTFVVGGFPLLVGPLDRDSTVYIILLHLSVLVSLNSGWQVKSRNLLIH